MIAGLLGDLLMGFNYVMLAYFAVLNVIYTLLLVLGWRAISTYVRRRRLIDYDEIARSPLTMPISMVVPAYNEGPVIVDSVRALLGARYPTLEVVVVSDGSTDDTLDALIREFSLVPATRVPVASLATAEIQRILVCPDDDRLVVIDKANGGKADAINAALCYARYPLFCTIDADTLIEDDALLRLVRPFQVEPDTVACGGIVRVVNGCTVEGSRVVDVHMPRRLIENVQVVEYLRAFLAGRTGWAKLGALLIISGAFGVFRRDLAVACGGYDTTTVGEDAEFVVRLHRYCRDNEIPYRVSFLADPVCWTEVPRSFRVLCRQRNRWHRGLLETLSRHRGMIGRPRYGIVGLLGMPYFALFEALGPLVETLGYLVAATSLVLGSARSADRPAAADPVPDVRARALVRRADRGGARLPPLPLVALRRAHGLRRRRRELRLSPDQQLRARVGVRDAPARLRQQLGRDVENRLHAGRGAACPAPLP